MTRRPTVMTRRLGGHQAVWRGQERAFSLPFTFHLSVNTMGSGLSARGHIDAILKMKPALEASRKSVAQ